MRQAITTTPQVLINEILGSIAWRHLAIADIDNLDEDPVDQYSRIKIREALAEAFLAGAAWGLDNTKGTK
jgi:hypothetical protein